MLGYGFVPMSPLKSRSITFVSSSKLPPSPILVMENILTNKSNYQTNNLYENYNRSPYLPKLKPHFSQREQFEVMAQKVHWNAMYC